MRISFIVDSMYPAQRGPANAVYWKAKALKAAGHDIKILTTNREIESLQLNIWMDTEFGKVKYVKCKFPKLALNLIPEIPSLIKQSDFLHLNSLLFPPSFLTAFYSAIFEKIPLIWSIHGGLQKGALKKYHFPKRMILFFLQFIKNKVHFHALTKDEEKYIKKIFGEVKIITIPNMMKLPRQANLQETERPYFLFLGNINHNKGIDILIEAFSIFRNHAPEAPVLMIAGKGPKKYVQKLKSKIKLLNLDKCVHFAGHVTGSEKQKLLSQARALILPSRYEIFGIVVLESLAQGTPVIASENSPWEILNIHGAGYWIDNSPSSIAHGMATFLTMSSEEYNAMRKNALALVQEYFDVNKLIDRWISVYISVIANNL